MQKYFRLFISSTFKELKAPRIEIIYHIASKGDIPVGMEFFEPDFKPAESLIKEKIRSSDAVILCIGANAGSLVGGSGKKTYIEKEIEWAKEFGKRVYAFASETYYESGQKIIDSYADNFGGHFRTYTDQDDLVKKFKSHYWDIIGSLKQVEGIGLIEATDFERFKSILDINRDVLSVDVICGIIENLAKPRKMIGRMVDYEDARKYAGFTLWRKLGNLFFTSNRKIKIYYDGGASVLYAGLALIHYLKRYPITSKEASNRVTISSFTNAPLTQLNNFFLSESYNKITEPSTLLPKYGYYVDYGTCLGDIMNYNPADADTLWQDKKYFTQENLDYKIKGDLLSALDKYSIIVSSISGYSLESSRQKRGPWIRSYPNYVFKLILLSLKVPMVFLLDEHKWDRSMQENRSINLLPEEYLNKESELPICYVLATDDKKKHKSFVEYFLGIGFLKREMIDDEYHSVYLSGDSEGMYGVVVYTPSFEKYFA